MNDLPNELLVELCMYLSTDDLLVMEGVLPQVVNDHYFQGKHQYTYNTFYQCCYRGLVEGVKLYLIKGFDLTNSMDAHHRSFLHLAVAYGYGDINTVKTLIDVGANLNAIDIFGRTPLWYATNYRDNRIDMVKLFVDAGADLNIGSNSGMTPLCIATRNGHMDIMKLLLEAGVDVNALGRNGWTPLHFADTIYTINLLIKNGADMNITNKNGRTPLRSAMYYGQTKTVKLLESIGAAIYKTDLKHVKTHFLVNKADGRPSK